MKGVIVRTILVAALAVSMMVFFHGAGKGKALSIKDKPANTLDIGFDYRGFIAEHMKLLTDGHTDKALDFLEKHVKNKNDFPAQREALKQWFGLVSGMGGKYEGYEVVGYKRLSSRTYKFYVLASYEKVDLVVTYLMEKSQGEWKLMGFGLKGKLEEIEQLIPFRQLEEGWKAPGKESSLG